MSEEIVNNEVQNPVTEQEQQITPTLENTEQTDQKGGSAQTEEHQKEETPKEAKIYTKIGTESKQKVEFFSDESRNAIAREAAEVFRNREAKVAEKQAIIDKFNSDIVKLEAEIKELNEILAEKSEISCSGERRRIVNCDVFEAGDEIIYVEKGQSPENESAIVARTQRLPEKQENTEEK